MTKQKKTYNVTLYFHTNLSINVQAESERERQSIWRRRNQRASATSRNCWTDCKKITRLTQLRLKTKHRKGL